MSTPLLELSGVSKLFPTARGQLHAVDGVSFRIEAGEAFGLVGESGSGKSTIGRLALGLIAPSAGDVRFMGQSIVGHSERALKPFRRQAQMVFQDPYSSLNPRLRVREIIGEALDAHDLAQDRRNARIAELLEMVGLQTAHATRYPHEFSGGQRQRIGIARALAVEPRLLIADEPVSALDVSVQAQIITLLQDLRRHLGLALLFISHDLEIVELLCERVAVLYLGRVMETGTTQEVMQSPRHPYSHALLSAVPKADPAAPRVKRLVTGDIPSPLDPPSGCVFRTRCFHADAACAQTRPVLSPDGARWQSACLRDPVSFQDQV
jgi:peptide/nickel transport system ATP-binding protein